MEEQTTLQSRVDMYRTDLGLTVSPLHFLTRIAGRLLRFSQQSSRETTRELTQLETYILTFPKRIANKLSGLGWDTNLSEEQTNTTAFWIVLIENTLDPTAESTTICILGQDIIESEFSCYQLKLRRTIAIVDGTLRVFLSIIFEDSANQEDTIIRDGIDVDSLTMAQLETLNICGDVAKLLVDHANDVKSSLIQQLIE